MLQTSDSEGLESEGSGSKVKSVQFEVFIGPNSYSFSPFSERLHEGLFFFFYNSFVCPNLTLDSNVRVRRVEHTERVRTLFEFALNTGKTSEDANDFKVPSDRISAESDRRTDPRRPRNCRLEHPRETHRIEAFA